MASDSRIGVILINLGTPEAPTPRAVASYLNQFLMDPFVIDVPWLARWLLVKGLIIPRRSRSSARQYEKIWTTRGSPLLFHTLDLANKVQALLGERFVVRPAMRYGSPSISNAVNELSALGVFRYWAAPLYPQYSLAATESSIVETKLAFQATPRPESVEFLPAFYSDPRYLNAVAEVSRAPLAASRADAVLFSFHGLPAKHIRKVEQGERRCLLEPTCCDRIESRNALCYRAQCYFTARELAKRFEIPDSKWLVGFQSRLNERWIQPFSDAFYRDLPSKGIKRVAVLCPSFVADCLETLEEVTIRGQEEFQKHGGESLVLIPSLNSSDAWAETLATMARESVA